MTSPPHHPRPVSDYIDYMRQHAPELTALRRRIHQNPELGFEEHDTSELVAQYLERWGYEVERGLGRTGVVGRLRRGRGPRTLGLRADMDALPMDERTGLPHASRRPGAMHACGHDGHTAMLLGAARFLAEQGDFSGTLNLIFQPAEEGLGGARCMLADGLFDKYPCDAIYAMHNMPGVPQGRLVFREGPALASSDYVTVTLRGLGGHGAMPHLAVDPIVAAASIVLALQTIVSRNTDPQQTAVVTVGAIHAGQANNIVPDTAVMEISVRALDQEVRTLLERRLRAIVQAQAQSFGVQADIDYRPGYAVLVSTAAETEFARSIGRELVGADQITEQGPAATGSEDFAFMLEQRPGSYLHIGNGAGEGHGHGACTLHHPGYDFNDDNLVPGPAYWCCLAERYLR